MPEKLESNQNLLSSFDVVAHRKGIEIARCIVVAENEYGAKREGWREMSFGPHRAFDVFDESIELRVEKR
jgi:hypothetical protein